MHLESLATSKHHFLDKQNVMVTDSADFVSIDIQRESLVAVAFNLVRVRMGKFPE